MLLLNNAVIGTPLNGHKDESPGRHTGTETVILCAWHTRRRHTALQLFNLRSLWKDEENKVRIFCLSSYAVFVCVCVCVCVCVLCRLYTLE